MIAYNLITGSDMKIVLEVRKLSWEKKNIAENVESRRQISGPAFGKVFEPALLSLGRVPEFGTDDSLPPRWRDMFVLAYKKIDPYSMGIAVRAKIFSKNLKKILIPVQEEMVTKEKPGPSYYSEAVINKRISAEIKRPLVIIRKLQYFTVAFRGYPNR